MFSSSDGSFHMFNGVPFLNTAQNSTHRYQNSQWGGDLTPPHSGPWVLHWLKVWIYSTTHPWQQCNGSRRHLVTHSNKWVHVYYFLALFQSSYIHKNYSFATAIIAWSLQDIGDAYRQDYGWAWHNPVRSNYISFVYFVFTGMEWLVQAINCLRALYGFLMQIPSSSTQLSFHHHQEINRTLRHMPTHDSGTSLITVIHQPLVQ